jgi:hypothetical protein
MHDKVYEDIAQDKALYDLQRKKQVTDYKLLIL